MMTREEALSRIRMNPKMVPAGQDPEAFIAAMMAADAANSAPVTPPVEVSPADPAPVQAGIPIVAPPPMAPPMPPMATDFRNQAILAANQTRPPGTDLISGNSGKDVVVPAAPVAPPAVAPPKLSLTPEEEAKLLQSGPDVVKKARDDARLPEEMKSYFDAIGQRTEAEIADVSKERKQQYWMALALAGAKMAQSQSPYFASALAEGLESGLTGFNKARADASEKKARLQTRKEDLILKRFETLERARDDAVNDLKAGYDITKTQQELVRSTKEDRFNDAIRPYQFKTAVAAADKAVVEAEYAEKTIIAGLNLTRAQTSAAMANAAQSYASAELSRATIRQGVRDGNVPKGLYEMYDADQTTVRQLLISADKLGPGEPGYQSLIDQAQALAKESKLRIAPYTTGSSIDNPVRLGKGEVRNLSPGQYFTRDKVPGVYTQKANAGPPLAKGRAAGAARGTRENPKVYNPKTGTSE
jgi:hypothetical protein